MPDMRSGLSSWYARPAVSTARMVMQTYRVPNEAYACTGPSVMCRQNCRDARNDYGNYVDYDDYLPGALAERIPVKSPTRSAPPVARRYLADAWQG